MQRAQQKLSDCPEIYHDCAGMLPPGQHLVIGLNPPFGKNNALARKFVMHAARAHSPRVIVLIVPRDTPIPEGYIVMYEDQTTMAGRCITHPCPVSQTSHCILFQPC